MFNSIAKKISENSMGLLPTVKSVWLSFFYILVIIFSVWLFIHTINSSKPAKPDNSQILLMKKAAEQDYLIKIKNAKN